MSAYGIPKEKVAARFIEAVAAVTGVASSEVLVVAGWDRADRRERKVDRTPVTYARFARHLLWWAAREWMPGSPTWRQLGALFKTDHTTIRNGHVALSKLLRHPVRGETTRRAVQSLLERMLRDARRGNKYGWPGLVAHLRLRGLLDAANRATVIVGDQTCTAPPPPSASCSS